ncbi:MAG: Trm112 family protein [Zoogloeaceae bacterium]|jgi:uncharacterized protein YbaR (Trm112 family)|nr:Trm112 family protein [Zoogloeaceae bacterium]
MDAKLLDILVCPVCKGQVHYNKTEREIVCRACKLVYPIRDDIPILLEEEARELTQEER